MLVVASRSSRYICQSCRSSLKRSTTRSYVTTTPNPNAEDIYDVVTVGGGPVGLALLTAISMSLT